MCTIEHLPFSPNIGVCKYIRTPYSHDARPPAKTSFIYIVWWQKIYQTLTPPRFPPIEFSRSYLFRGQLHSTPAAVL